MDLQVSCGSYLPLIWAIEALACSDHVETSLLLDLLKKASQYSNHIGKNATELLSFKFLERLLVQGARANPLSSASSKTVRLDPSDHCLDVLRQILNEISLSHTKPAGLEISKWDLEPFIEHKRSNLPKCALEQLKEAILTGSHSVSSSLKEQSGLLVGSRTEHQAPAKDGNCNGFIPLAVGSDADDVNVLPTDSPDGSLEPVNKKRRASESPAEQLYATHLNRVKNNNHGVMSNEQYAGEQLISSEICINISDTSTVSVKRIEEKRCHVKSKTNVGNMGILEPPDSDINECTSSRLGEHNEVFPCGKQVPHVDTELNNKFEEQQRQNQNIKEGGKNEICDHKRTNEDVDQHMSNVDKAEENVHVSDDNDKIDIARKDDASLSPQYKKNQDSLETTNTRDLCALAYAAERFSKVRCSLEEESCVEFMRQTESHGDGKNQHNSSKVLVGNVHNPHCGTEVLNENLDAAIQNSEGEKTESRRSSHGLISTNEDVDKFDQNVPRIVSTVVEAEEDVNTSSDNDGYHDERITIDTKKKTFLSSQCTYSEDSLSRTDLREVHLCMKCNKGGNVFHCNSDSCPIVIHQSCLGSDASFDRREPFYCPFCAYSQAISKYMEVKKHTSLARKDLMNFICSGPENESNKQPLKKNDALPKVYELNQTNDVEKGSSHQCAKKLEFEQAEHSQLRSDYNPPFGRKATVSTGRSVQSANKDKQNGKRIREESQPLRDCKQQQIAVGPVHNSQRETRYCQISETGKSEKHADFSSKKEILRPPETDLPCDRKCSQSSQSTDSEEISEYENDDSGTSKYFIKVRKQARQNLYPAIPQMRRKKIRWTSEEEDVLKRGMKLFCSSDDKIIPWKKILEFGEGKFQPSRNAMDLKDKWRNMCKAGLC